MRRIGRRLVQAHDPGRAGPATRYQIPHRRRDRRARSGVALPARRRARAERGDRSGLRLADARTGTAGRGTNACFSNCMSAPSREQGTFRGVIDKLDHVAATGITAIELMPVADFSGPLELGLRRRAALRAGQRLWPARRPQGADRRRAPARPDGVSRRRLQPLRAGGKLSRPLSRRSSSRQAQTPWGNAIDYQRAGGARGSRSRTRCIGSSDFRFDGLRLDAVHAIAEPGRTALLHEMSEAAGALAARDRPAHPSGAGKRRQPGEPARSARPIRRAANIARNGTTTIITPSMCC